MKAVILAGGMGKRALPLNVFDPKFMIKFLGKPIIFHLIEKIKENGIYDIILVLGESAEKVQKQITETYPDINFRFTIQEKPLGQADALQTAEQYLDDNFIVTNANDVFPSELFRDMIDLQKEKNCAVVGLGVKSEDYDKYGFFKFENEKVVGIIEKPGKENPPSDIANLSCWLLSKEIFERFKKYPNEEYLFEKCIDELMKEKGGEVIVDKEYHQSYKSPQDVLKVNDVFLNLIKETKISEKAEISEKVVIEGNVIIEEGVKVLEGAVIRGPCYLGKNTIIGNNVLIREKSCIGDECTIGNQTEIKHSYVGDKTLTHLNYIGDSIIEGECNLGAGTVFCNYRFDGQNVFIKVKGKKVNTETSKFGVVMAKYCKTGSNCTILPGIKLGPNSIVYPSVLVRQDLEANKIIKEDGKIIDNTLNLDLQKRSKAKQDLAKSLFK